MPNGLSDFLIDTNIAAYAFDRAEPAKQERAITVLDRLAASARGAMSTQVLAEFFSTVTTKTTSALSAEEGRARLEEFTRNFTIYAVTPAIVLEAARAVEERRMSFWDAQVWATAKLNQVPVVLSEDLQGWDFLEGVQFLNPLAESFDLSLLG